jgi:predicted Zn-ribbon and HTH transcriptional regulator
MKQTDGERRARTNTTWGITLLLSKMVSKPVRIAAKKSSKIQQGIFPTMITTMDIIGVWPKNTAHNTDKNTILSVKGVSMENIENYETKEIECDKCGRVSTVAKHIPLKQAWCPECRSSRIRLYKPKNLPAGIALPDWIINKSRR